MKITRRQALALLGLSPVAPEFDPTDPIASYRPLMKRVLSSPPVQTIDGAPLNPPGYGVTIRISDVGVHELPPSFRYSAEFRYQKGHWIVSRGPWERPADFKS